MLISLVFGNQNKTQNEKIFQNEKIIQHDNRHQNNDNKNQTNYNPYFVIGRPGDSQTYHFGFDSQVCITIQCTF